MKYTREQLEAMPDRERDAVVAERVMGWTFNEDVVYDEDDCRCPPLTAVKDGNRFRRLPEFSTDIAAAWEVVDELHLRKMWVGMTYKCGILDDFNVMGWEVWLRGEGLSGCGVYAHHQDKCRAISIAAVIAVQEATR